MSSSDSNDARIDSRLRLASSVRASILSFVWSPLSPLEWPFAVDIRQIKTVFSCLYWRAPLREGGWQNRGSGRQTT